MYPQQLSNRYPGHTRTHLLRPIPNTNNVVPAAEVDAVEEGDVNLSTRTQTDNQGHFPFNTPATDIRAENQPDVTDDCHGGRTRLNLLVSSRPTTPNPTVSTTVLVSAPSPRHRIPSHLIRPTTYLYMPITIHPPHGHPEGVLALKTRQYPASYIPIYQVRHFGLPKRPIDRRRWRQCLSPVGMVTPRRYTELKISSTMNGIPGITLQIPILEEKHLQQGGMGDVTLSVGKRLLDRIEAMQRPAGGTGGGGGPMVAARGTGTQASMPMSTPQHLATTATTTTSAGFACGSSNFNEAPPRLDNFPMAVHTAEDLTPTIRYSTPIIPRQRVVPAINTSGIQTDFGPDVVSAQASSWSNMPLLGLNLDTANIINNNINNNQDLSFLSPSTSFNGGGGMVGNNNTITTTASSPVSSYIPAPASILSAEGVLSATTYGGSNWGSCEIENGLFDLDMDVSACGESTSGAGDGVSGGSGVGKTAIPGAVDGITYPLRGGEGDGGTSALNTDPIDEASCAPQFDPAFFKR